MIVGCFEAGAASPAEEILGDGGKKIEIVVRLPADFDADSEYSVMVSPGDYYWKNSVSPQGWIVAISDGFFGDGRVTNSKRVLDWLRQRYKIRGDRFHIAGWSANSAGVFEIVMAYPEEFASVTGIAGMPGRGSEDELSKLAETHVQFIVGERDHYWRQGSERWHQLMQEEGISSTLEIIQRGDHVMPEIANEPIFERMNRLVERIEAES